MPPLPPEPTAQKPTPADHVEIVDPATGQIAITALYHRQTLAPGATLAGPALIVEDETSTYVTAAFVARINGLGHIVMTRRDP